jgi:hypothetical protein
MRRVQSALPLALALAASAAWPDSPPTRLANFVQRPEQQSAMASLASNQWKALYGNCDSLELKGAQLLAQGAVEFDADGFPKKGLFSVAYRLAGCGQEHRLTVVSVVAPDGTLKRQASLPGTTIADVLLQRDSLPYARLALARVEPRDCTSMRVLDTRFLTYGAEGPAVAPGRDKRAWNEQWTVDACGTEAIVTMHFVPDATGTAIRSSPSETRLADKR